MERIILLLFPVVPICASIFLLKKAKKMTVSVKETLIVLDIFSIIFALIISYVALSYCIVTY